MPLVKDSSGPRLRFLKARMSRVVEERIFRGVSQFLTAIFIIISHTNEFNLRKMHGRCTTASLKNRSSDSVCEYISRFIVLPNYIETKINSFHIFLVILFDGKHSDGKHYHSFSFTGLLLLL